MSKLAVRFVTIALALVGLATVAKWIWPTARGVSPAPNSLTFINSPDGAFKAALASWNGGDGISPFCYDRVFVVPGAAAADQVVDEQNVVFEGDCGFFAPKNGRAINSPELTWREPRVLALRFSTNEAAVAPAMFRLRRLAAQGQVAVEFQVGH